jgi:hypothetical protein
MSVNSIVVSTNSFQSDNQYDIIASNTQYIRKLFKHKITEDKISEDALKSYYVDYYLSYICYSGFSKFIENFSNQPKVLYYISAGLETMKSKKHLAFFQKVFFQDNHYLEKNTLDKEFKQIQKTEDLLYVHHRWLMNHPDLMIMDCNDIEKNFKSDIESLSEKTRHIDIIKQLCTIVNEDFLTVTAGDINNIYNKSWYFKTVQGRYYMIERKNIVTMYNSYTKKEVIKGQLIENSSQKPTLLNLISKIFKYPQNIVQRFQRNDYYSLELSS